RTIDATELRRIDSRIDRVRITWSDGDADASETLFERRQTLRQWMPRVAAVGSFVESTAWTLPRAVLPWSLSSGPQVRVNDFRVLRIESECGGAGVLVFVENFLPRLTA